MRQSLLFLRPNPPGPLSAAARGVLSANYGDSNVSGQSVVSDFSDTALLMRLRQKHLGTGKEETITNAIASAVVNIHPDPINFWDFRTQVIYNDGLAGLTRMESLIDLALTRSTSLFGSIRYLKRTLERPSFQIALSGGFKSYSDVEVTTDQWQVIGIGALRAGEGARVQFALR